MPQYLAWLRQHLGHQPIIFTCAGAIIRDERGRVLLQKRSDFGLWDIPGGGQELGESVAETVVREAREEVGLDVEPKRLIGVYTSPRLASTYPNGDQVQFVAVYFECAVVGGELKTDGDEVLELDWFNLDNLPSTTPLTTHVLKDIQRFRGEALFDPAENSDKSPIDYMTFLRQHIGHDKVILPGAAGMIRDENGRVLLQRRRDNGLWGFPGGLMELGESATRAVIREFREEVGLDVEPKRLVGVYTSPKFDRSYPNGDQSQLFISFYECQLVGGGLRAQESEVLELGWFDLNDLPPMVACCEAKAHDARIFKGEAFWR
ncbi:MAG: NUDIX domain-containing protein [Chloroflexi bacterium]|nr:NUDIX domain-containing protein [Chloroflexota bacterium]